MVRIHGLTLIRDEWPLALLSINHALLHHVDRLHCAVQVSTDATLEGVQRLRGFWGERLTVVEIRTDAYLQEAIVATLVRQLAAAADPGDWLYGFDADEFAVTPSALPLREQIAARPSDDQELRYPVWNWIAPVDFDDRDLPSYGRIRHRALPCVFLSLPPHILAEEIGRGFVNYFDLPFYDKGLFRLDALRERWLGPGAHRLRPPAAPGLPCFEESDLFATALEPALALTLSLLEAAPAPDPPLPLSEEACLRTIHQLQNQLKDLHRDLMRHGVNQVATQWYGSGASVSPP